MQRRKPCYRQTERFNACWAFVRSASPTTKRNDLSSQGFRLLHFFLSFKSHTGNDNFLKNCEKLEKLWYLYVKLDSFYGNFKKKWSESSIYVGFSFYLWLLDWSYFLWTNKVFFILKILFNNILYSTSNSIHTYIRLNIFYNSTYK